MLTKLLKMLSNIRQNRKTHISKKSILESSFIPIFNKPRIKKKMKDEEELEKTIDNYTSWYHPVPGINQQKIEVVVNEVFTETVKKSPNKTNTKSKIQNKAFDLHPETRRSIFFTNTNDYKSAIVVIKYPTNNCQLSSLMDAANLVYINTSVKEELFKEIYNCTNRQILIDIKQVDCEQIESLFKEYMDMVIKTPYISTNGSNMVLYIYKWKEDLNFKNE